MDARPNTRPVDRDRKPAPPQPPRGAKQIVIPMTRTQYDETWHDPRRVRAFVEGWLQSAPELFPDGFDRGYRLHGFGRRSRKLVGLRLRKVVTGDGCSYWLRPSFIAGYMAGTVDELAYPLLLAAHGVPAWLLKVGFGRGEMSWHRLVERLGHCGLVGTTVRDPARLPLHLAADEHHADRSGAKGDLATTAGGGCILGVALTASADDVHLREAYGVFAAEARDVAPGYAPETVNADGWAATRNAFLWPSPSVAVILCFLHGFLKVRDRCGKARDLHRRVWDVYRAATAEEFRRLMGEFRAWCVDQTGTAPVRAMLEKLWAKTEAYAVAYDHPGCHRTSNAVDRPMDRLCRLMYAGRGLHGHQTLSRIGEIQASRVRSAPNRAFVEDVKQLTAVIRRLIRGKRRRPHPMLMLATGAFIGAIMTLGGVLLALAGKAPVAPPKAWRIPTLDLSLLKPVSDPEYTARAIFLISEKTAIIPLAGPAGSGKRPLSLATYPETLITEIADVIYECEKFSADVELSEEISKRPDFLKQNFATRPTIKLKRGVGTAFSTHYDDEGFLTAPITMYVFFKNGDVKKMMFRMQNIRVQE